MNRNTYMGDRFRELRQLLRSYEVTGNEFDDTADRPGAALSAYQRSAGRDSARVAAAVEEIDDLLTTGLFSDELADDIELLPHVTPPQGGSVEESLRIIRHHLTRPAEAPADGSPTRPETSWEWREKFPGLAHFLTAYFHQNFSLEYSSHEEAIDDYLSDSSSAETQQLTSELEEFMMLNPSNTEMRQAAQTLGLMISPPPGMTLRKWLENVEVATAQHGKS
ncbi:contact-dependent growth inhibition system immunity protein [Streptomyces beijiangensis]|uniref:CdiI immunity protein domain-containing protein n=1 Tax=Streptomyces beijiangensis TaxID=163361 RepID=A0A939JIX5_9ACTN|nr:contact-dependent growth inhibition system immunity protein [Streptomyces beijiangensis]MBO0513034.1 hypothetical protein [Streptomyces beijiangensis]